MALMGDANFNNQSTLAKYHAKKGKNLAQIRPRVHGPIHFLATTDVSLQNKNENRSALRSLPSPSTFQLLVANWGQ